MGIWEWGFYTDKIEWSDNVFAIFGVKKSSKIDFKQYESMRQAHGKEGVGMTFIVKFKKDL